MTRILLKTFLCYIGLFFLTFLTADYTLKIPIISQPQASSGGWRIVQNEVTFINNCQPKADKHD